MVRKLRLSIVLVTATSAACVHPAIKPASLLPKEDRRAVIERAKVWTPTDVAHADILKGPPDEQGFAFNQTVTCDYVDKKMEGASPKFSCAITPDDVVKVKYGRDNGEVFAEVA